MRVNFKQKLFLLKEAIIELSMGKDTTISEVRLLEKIMNLKIERVGLVHRLESNIITK